MKPKEQGPSSVPVVIRRRQVLALPLILAGCAEPYVSGGGTRPPPSPPPGPGPQRVATLDVEGDVELAQGGRRFRGQDGNALFQGDEVRTSSNSYALLTFLDGDRVWLDYDTRVRVGSLFTFFGRVFASVSGVFQVDSDFVAASSEGTEYTVTVGRGARNAFSVAVRSGVVRCAPRRGRWGPIRMGAGQRMRAQGDSQPVLDQLDSREAQEEFGWVGARRAPDRTPIPQERFTPRPTPSPTPGSTPTPTPAPSPTPTPTPSPTPSPGPVLRRKTPTEIITTPPPPQQQGPIVR